MKGKRDAIVMAVESSRMEIPKCLSDMAIWVFTGAMMQGPDGCGLRWGRMCAPHSSGCPTPLAEQGRTLTSPRGAFFQGQATLAPWVKRESRRVSLTQWSHPLKDQPIAEKLRGKFVQGRT
jgi:hypothetical protein